MCITVTVAEDGLLTSMIDAKTIADSLGINQSGYYISDLLPHDTLYKPLSYDVISMPLTGTYDDTVKKLVKKLKSAKYIQKDLLQSMINSTDIIEAAARAEIEIINGVICRPYSQIIVSGEDRYDYQSESLIKKHIKKDTVYDVYIGALNNCQPELTIGDLFCADGVSFRISSIESFLQPGGDHYVIQTRASAKAISVNSDYPDSIFRITSDNSTYGRCFVQGSVFSMQDRYNITDQTGCMPFCIMWR